MELWLSDQFPASGFLSFGTFRMLQTLMWIFKLMVSNGAVCDLDIVENYLFPLMLQPLIWSVITNHL
ncbi:hypothetical protein GQ55_3G430500 [Panicum hallii var. hallii]|uniref:Uncharacterized protein n=1 Tax=Panicum hallii var. hallii TaxID=1504633 RepID=A0A2T7EHS6_9POAL|nr:hypothetical protein GQ55_3G430500 [Panicum hallii var. hallii]